MKYKRTHFIGCLVGIALAAACGGQVAPDEPGAGASDSELATHQQDLTVPPIQPAELGRAFDSQSQELLFRSCVSGEPDLGTDAIGVLQTEHNLSFSDVLDKVAGSVDVGFQIAVVKAGAGASIANQHASTSLAETTHLVWISNTKSDLFKPDSIHVNGNGQLVLDTRPGELQKLCGDEFITEVKRGASFLATLKLEFLNDEDRRELQGKLNVDVSAGLVRVDGSLNSVDQAKLRRTSLSVMVKQDGGRPERMLGILPDALMTCSLENRAPCLQVFENLIKYGRDDFSVQVAERLQQNVLGYLGRQRREQQAARDRATAACSHGR